jgi:hypothetical protein
MEAAFAFSVNGEGVNTLWTNPEWEGRGEFLGHFEADKSSDIPVDKDYIYIGVKSLGPDGSIPQSDIFIQASPALLKYLRWGRWRFGGTDGILGEPVIPGRTKLEAIRNRRMIPGLSVWGHNYYPYEHREEYRDNFFELTPGQAGPAPADLSGALPAASIELVENLGPLYWIQIESDRKIPSQDLKSFELAATNCVVALNAHYLKQNYFYHGPGPMEINPQNKADEIYEIVSLDDNQGRSYSNIYTSPGNGEKQSCFVPRIDGNVFSLIVTPPETGPLPDRFSLSYRISSGETANGIDPGLLNSLYNPQPGVESVINIISTRGGTSARSFNDMIKVFPRVLQSSNRAVVPSDFESLAVAFDKRIIAARAANGSVERDGVLRGCIEMELDLGGYSFDLPEEESLFLSRLAKYLEMRSPVGTVVTARIAG